MTRALSQIEKILILNLRIERINSLQFQPKSLVVLQLSQFVIVITYEKSAVLKDLARSCSSLSRADNTVRERKEQRCRVQNENSSRHT